VLFRLIALLFFLQQTLVFASGTNVTLRLSWKHQFQFAGYYMAKELGYYKDVGLDVDIKEYEYGVDLTEDILNKKVDFSVGRSTIIADRLNGKNIVALAAIIQNSPLVLVTINPKLKIPKDLKNKKIMITSDAKSSASIYAMMFANGLQESDFKVMEHSFNLEDLINQKTDAMNHIG